MEKPAPSHPLDAHFTRNTIGVSLVEFIWGFGMPPVFESTFLQLFLHSLGASSFLICVVPTLASLGSAVASLLSYSLTSHLERKRPVVVMVHLASALPILAFGLILAGTGRRASTLSLFLILYGLFSTIVGLIMPVWQNYLMKIFSSTRVVRAMAALSAAQGVAKLVGSLSLVRVVERWSFSPEGASIVFICVGALFFVGSLPFLLTVEPGKAIPPGLAAPLLPRAPLRVSLRRVFANRRFLSFLGTDLEFFALSGVLAFYANFATQFCGVNPALASGLFMACNYLGAVTVNTLLGWARLLSARGTYLVTKSLAVGAIVFLALYPAPWAFYLVSFLFGVSRGARMMVFTPTVKHLSAEADATLYFSVAPVLSLPFSIGIPLLGGAFLDRFASHGAGAYKVVFLVMAAIGSCGVFFAARMKKNYT